MTENLSELVGQNESEIVTLTNESFSKFYSILSVLSKDCTDLTIKNGIICQMTDRRSSIYNLDLSPIIGNVDVMMSGLQSKCEMFEPFKKQGVEVSLVLEGDKYWFKDDVSEIEVTRPIERYLNNEHIAEEQLQERLSLAEGQPIFQITMQPFLINRLSSYSKAMSATIVRLDFTGEKVSFTVTPGDNTSAVTARLANFDLNVETEAICGFPVNPFLMSTQDLNIECFNRSDGENILLKLSTEVEGIPIEVWCMSRATNPNEVQ